VRSFRLRSIKLWVLFAALVLTTSSGLAQTPGSTIRVAIVGLVHGHVAGFLPTLKDHPEVQLVGIQDPDQTLAKRYQRQFHLQPSLFYTSLDTMLERTHPDAVLVYTAISDHRRVIETAAAHHVSVMVEKPLATSLADALAIRSAARAQHIHVLVNYETTWYASNRAAYNAVQDGTLGTLRKVIVRDGHNGPKEIGVQPEFLAWLTDPQKNGAGALFDFGCYGADLVTWLMHGETPVSVTAVAQTDKPAEYPHVDDDATIIVRYPGMQAVLMPSWNWSYSIKDMALYGTKGDAVTVGLSKIRMRVGNTPAKVIAAPPIPPPNADPMQYLAAVLHGKLVPKGDLTALDTNMIVMQILDAARESVRTGRTIQLHPLPKE
jgi:glucose-fructose oxidoreductase